ncbi:MAG TPA: DNA polymerase III, partial [Candidatus Eisenbacteria bacterium]|nr:DNA polymerase III [Candidatus Eisenbacteria bacterium]
MPVYNTDIAELFHMIADLLEIEGGNRFRIRAYRDAARTIEGLSGNVTDMIRAGEDLSTLPGIGKDLAGKIKTFVEKGSLPLLKELEKRIPAELVTLMKIRGLGASRVRALHEELGISGVEDLRKAAREGTISGLEGFGKKTEQAILEELDRLDSAGGRIKLFRASEIARSLIAYLEELDGVKKVVIAGSYRRGRETVGDLDILIAAKRGVDASGYFVKYDDVRDILSRGESKASVLLDSGLQVDLRIVPAASFGAALLYFTGSKEHNIALRKIAQKRKW